MKNFLLLLVCPLGLLSDSFGQEKIHPHGLGNKGYVQENQGQIKDQNWQPRKDVLFAGQSIDFDFYLRNNGISYQLTKLSDLSVEKGQKGSIGFNDSQDMSIYRVDLNWIGANTHLSYELLDEQEGYTHFYNVASGSDPALFVKNYGQLKVKNVWEGIDLLLHFREGHLEADWHVEDPASIHKIQFRVSGADLKIDEEGYLLFTTPFGVLREGKIKITQGTNTLKGKWVLKGNVVGFEVESFVTGIPIVIDPPTRIWGTYFGGNNVEYIFAMDIDKSDNIYASGNTSSSYSIATTGSHQTVFVGGFQSGFVGDGFIAKFNPSGNKIWATYYGGSGAERAYGCKLDSAGNLYFVGLTNSDTGIATVGAYKDSVPGGNREGFLVKLNSSGVRQWATYTGGELVDDAVDCDVDASHNVYIIGRTNSTSGIASAGAWQSAKGSYYDAYIMKFTASGQHCWGTYLGGFANDEANALAIDKDAFIYVTGTTGSTASIGYNAPFRGNKNGGLDVFLTKFDSSGRVRWSNYFGGHQNDEGHGCILDPFGNIIIAGFTKSTSDLATSNAFQDSLSGNQDFFVAKFSKAGNLTWATYYGGPLDEWAKYNACATDHLGNIYLYGQTMSPTGIASGDGYQTSSYGDEDGVLIKFNPNGVRTWGTYYGGVGHEYPYAGMTNRLGYFYLAGTTGSSNTIATNGAYQTTNSGGLDAFLVKFQTLESNLVLGSQAICKNKTPYTLTGPSYTSGGYTYKWIKSTTDSTTGFQVAGGNDSSANYNPGMTSINTWYRRLLIQNAVSDTSNVAVIRVIEPIAAWTILSDSLCFGDTLQIVNRSTASGDSILTVFWYWGDSLVAMTRDLKYLPKKVGKDSIRMVFMSAATCVDSIKTEIAIFPKPEPQIWKLDTGLLCPGASLSILSSSKMNGWITWYHNGNPVLASFDSVYVTGDPGVYSMEITTPVGCRTASDSVFVELAKLPDITWSWSADTLCQRSFLLLVDSTLAAGTYKRNWFVNSILRDTINPFNAMLTDTGTNRISLLLQTKELCMDSLFTAVYVKESPKISSIQGAVIGTLPDSSYTYTAIGQLGSLNSWGTLNGTILNGQDSASAVVQWMDTNYAFIGLLNENTNGCSDTFSQLIQINQAPVITSFSPNQGVQGDTIAILGYNFSKTTQVLFGGTSALSFNVVNRKEIHARVNNGSDGVVQVVNPYGSDSLGQFNFQGVGITPIPINGIWLYPNPFDQTLYIQIPSGLVGKEYSITDVQGKSVKSGLLLDLFSEINLEHIRPGMYLFHTEGQTIKLIKN